MTERTVDRALQAEAFTADVGDGLKTVRLVPDGITESTNGEFALDAEAAALMIEGFDRQGVELVIDFEHQTLGGAYSAPNGQAPAAGWITKLWYERDRGVLALVRWNPKTRDAIREGSYGYVSPVLIIRKTDGKAIGLHSAAVTNRPAIPRLERLAASQNAGTETETMTIETSVHPIIAELAGLIGMPVKSDTTGTAVLTACRDKFKALAADDAVAIAQSVRSVLGLSAAAGKNEVIVALTTRDASGASAELSVMRQSERDRRAKEVVDKYVQAMVINPNHEKQYAAAVALAQEDPAKLDALLARAKPWVEPGRTTPPTGRQTVIALAEREYRGNVGHQKATSLLAFVQNSLREKGLGKLSEQETSELAVV